MLIALVHAGTAAQLTLALGGFLGEDVAQKRAAPFNAATGGHLEALFRAALGLHLRHDYSIFSDIAPGASQWEDFGNPDNYF